MTILGQDKQETDAKNRTSTNSIYELSNPLEMVEKTFQAFESLNSDVQGRTLAQITILGSYEQEKDTKNRTSRNSAYELTNTLEMSKKTCQAFESLNFDVRARTLA